MSVVPCLDEALAQLNARFPKRDKSSDGGLGDKAHRKKISSHNPDESGTPEHRDADKVDDIRARDFDVDLRDAETGTTMEQVVQHWVRLCRTGKLWWVRYIIYKGRIWHASDGYQTRRYIGVNKHDKHVHVNSGFDEKSDRVKGTDWGLKDFRRKPKPVVKPAKPPVVVAPKPPVVAPKPPSNDKPPLLVVDGNLRDKTIRRWQEVMGTPVDGVISQKSTLVYAVQKRLRATVDHTLVVDGAGESLAFGVQRKTIEALQRYLRVRITRSLSPENSDTVKALQRRLNEGHF